MTSDQIKLQEHLNAIALQDKESGNMFSVVTELEHWASYDIHTVAQYEHYNAQAIHYDFYREINGHKPSWIDYDSMTTAEIHTANEALFNERDVQIIEEKKETEEYSRMVQKRKAKNKYQPNLALSGLKNLMAA
jgi:hypothetical protein